MSMHDTLWITPELRKNIIAHMQGAGIISTGYAKSNGTKLLPILLRCGPFGPRRPEKFGTVYFDKDSRQWVAHLRLPGLRSIYLLRTRKKGEAELALALAKAEILHEAMCFEIGEGKAREFLRGLDILSVYSAERGG